MTAPQRQVTAFLGLCLRAGQITSGMEACLSQVRSGAAAVVLADESLSEGSLKKLRDSCSFYRIPLYLFEPGTIGHAIGKDNRDVLCLRPGGMADKVLSILKDEPRL